MKHLFVYGTLMNDEVWMPLLGETFTRVAATLDGFDRRQLHGECYPAIRRASGSHVDGVLVTGLNAAHVRLLDVFEGAWYRRVPVRVLTEDGRSVPCETYVLRDRYRHLISGREWHNEEFRDRHLKRCIARWGR